jgi:hypothetical protein
MAVILLLPRSDLSRKEGDGVKKKKRLSYGQVVP